MIDPALLSAQFAQKKRLGLIPEEYLDLIFPLPWLLSVKLGVSQQILGDLADFGYSVALIAKKLC